MRIDHIGGAGIAEQAADRAPGDFVERLDDTALKQAGQLRLRSTSPCLSQHHGGNDSLTGPVETTTMHCPHDPVTTTTTIAAVQELRGPRRGEGHVP